MNRLKAITAALTTALTLMSCASYNAYQKAKTAEQTKNWDGAVVLYQKALEIDPDNNEYRMALDRARRESSRVHFEKGKTFQAAAIQSESMADQLRLAQLAMTELQLTVSLDTTNQFAAVELAKTVKLINDIQQANAQRTSLDEVKKRAQSTITKAQPPQLNPASSEPISLTFPRETPVKDIYRALGNAFGINVLFDQAIKDDRITIELRDVTAQQALERVMQAANHFYKVLDEKSIIVIPDNQQSRRDYEDLVIRTFYLSNGDAEQVTNVVRTMIEARNVFPLKALNAITIRDTADKVRIAEKIIEANDKAKAEVVVQVELVQMDLSRIRDIGLAITGFPGADGATSASANATPTVIGADGKPTAFTGGTLQDIARVVGSLGDLRQNVNFTLPIATYSLLKSLGNSELLANPELRISEGEKATLHIGERIPVPVTTIAAYNSTNTTGQNNNLNPYGTTSFQYQDVGIKVSMEPRVHHNREVTLKLTVEVSNQGRPVDFAGQRQPTFATRTIESTIRLKDGETNFLAGLIQSNKVKSESKTPFLGDLPLIGRLFTNEHSEETRTDLVLTMTPHIIRIPDITEEDLAPMWVGTGNNLTFRGVSPRIESQAGSGDPFTPARSSEQFAVPNRRGRGELPSGDEDTPAPVTTPMNPGQGTAPTDPFRRNEPAPVTTPPPPTNNPPGSAKSESTGSSRYASMSADSALNELAALRLAPRVSPQPSSLEIGPGDTKIWNVVGMDLDGLSAQELLLHFDPRALNVMEVTLGSAVSVDVTNPPEVEINRSAGTIRIRNRSGAPLQFVSGGDVLSLRVNGGTTGETYLVMENPDFHTGGGESIVAAVSGGRARVQ